MDNGLSRKEAFIVCFRRKHSQSRCLTDVIFIMVTQLTTQGFLTDKTAEVAQAVLKDMFKSGHLKHHWKNSSKRRHVFETRSLVRTI